MNNLSMKEVAAEKVRIQQRVISAKGDGYAPRIETQEETAVIKMAMIIAAQKVEIAALKNELNGIKGS